MAILYHTGIANNFSSNVVDGLYSIVATIQNASTTGAIMDHDNWNSIVFHSVQSVTSTSSNKGPNVLTGLPSHHWFNDLSSDGSDNDLGFDTDNGAGSTKNVILHKTGGEWRLRHNSHGHNYNYLITFTLASD